jgi:hypothetical protein
MNVSLGFAVATAGLLITAAGAVGMNVVLFRYVARLSSGQSTRAAKSAAFEFVFWLLAWAALGDGDHFRESILHFRDGYSSRSIDRYSSPT